MVDNSARIAAKSMMQTCHQDESRLSLKWPIREGAIRAMSGLSLINSTFPNYTISSCRFVALATGHHIFHSLKLSKILGALPSR